MTRTGTFTIGMPSNTQRTANSGSNSMRVPSVAARASRAARRPSGTPRMPHSGSRIANESVASHTAARESWRAQIRERGALASKIGSPSTSASGSLLHRLEQARHRLGFVLAVGVELERVREAELGGRARSRPCSAAPLPPFSGKRVHAHEVELALERASSRARLGAAAVVDDQTRKRVAGASDSSTPRSGAPWS